MSASLEILVTPVMASEFVAEIGFLVTYSTTDSCTFANLENLKRKTATFLRL
jgi:hypothetical protein